MRIKYLLGILFVSVFIQQLTAQSKKLTLEEAVLKQWSDFTPENLSQLNWIPGSDKFCYVKDSDDEWVMFGGNANDKKREVIVSLKELNEALQKEGLSEKKSFPVVEWVDGNYFRFTSDKNLVVWNIHEKTLHKVTSYQAAAANHDFSSINGIAYTVGNNLFISLPGEPDMRITDEKNPDIKNGEAAHRFEFGITKGTFWSPDGKKLAFYRMDESPVTNYPIYNLHNKPASVDEIKYPCAGSKSHHATVGVYDTDTKKTIFLKTGGDPEHYLTNITWSPDSKLIYIAELSREQNDLKLNSYDASSGDLAFNILKESHEKYIEPKTGPIFINTNPNELLWASGRDGYIHLYHYKYDGSYIGPVTKGEYRVLDVLGFDEKGKTVYVNTTYDGAVYRKTLAVDIQSGKTTVITKEKGTHNTKISSSGKYLIDNFSNLKTPRNISIVDTKKAAKTQDLLTADNPLKDYVTGQVNVFTIKSADGKTDLWCRMHLPVDFDETKKYPVLVYVYNGPQIQLIHDTWNASSSLWMNYMAQEGYIVFTVDGRGSHNRSQEFEQVIFRNLGVNETADQMKGVEYLNSLPYVDGSRMVLHGWSFGGFMTTNMMLKHPGVFNAGVAGGPVIDWSLYEIMYTERYMDTPETNPDGYKESNLLNFADQLEGKLMLIHGTSDDVVLWQHSLNFIEKCVSSGVQIDYFVYPGHPHNVRGADRLHLMEKVLTYLMENNN